MSIVIGAVALAAGSACIVFASAEAGEGLGYGNWLKEAGLGDGWYTGLMLASELAATVAVIYNQYGPKCFEAGTLVLCLGENGETCRKPIEEVAEEDYVWAYNEETGESDWKPVVRLFRNKTQAWYHITAADEEIVCTAAHPFYAVGKGFVQAKELKISDKLLLSDGASAIIEAIAIEELPQPEPTYNFEVADFHTYFVGEYGILVHNECNTTEWVDTVDDALTRAEQHLGPEQYYYVEKNGMVNKNIFVSKSDSGKIVRFDIKPEGHVLRQGPHFNLETYAKPFGTDDQHAITNIHLYWRRI